MTLWNTQRTYGWATISLHWIGAAGVITLYLLGLSAHEAIEEGLAREEIIRRIRLHMSVAVLLLVFLAARIAAHAAQAQPPALDRHRVLTPLSRWVQRTMLVLLALQLTTGVLLPWSSGRELTSFGWLAVPSPFPARVEWLHDAVETVHAISARTLMVLLGVHVLGALKHLVVDRNREILRIIGVARRGA